MSASQPDEIGYPNAAIDVVMTGHAILNASSNFTRWPVPENSGATKIVLGL